MIESDHVTVDVADGVGRVVVDRPERHNAMDPGVAEAIAAALDELASDGDVRCLVLTGRGGAFNTGADLSSLSGDERDAEAIDAVARPLHDAIRTMTRAPKPVVTGINGVAAGGGLGLALASDVAVMSADARFEYAYPRIGLSGDGGITWLLPRLLGLRRAQSFAMLGDPIEADEAVDRGLVTEAVPADAFEDRLAAVAGRVAEGPTVALGRIVKLFERSHARQLPDQLAAETDVMARTTETDDYREGVRAFKDGRSPEFTGR